MKHNRPILVTGTHRSGSTWVGDMLALSPQAHYVHEPFAPMHKRSWLTVPPRHRYYYEPPGEIGRYSDDLERIVRLKPPWLAIARRAGGPRNALRIAQQAASATIARRRQARALIKDPFALLLTEWIVARSDAQVVVLVRHPAAFAGSVKRLGWRLDVSWLLDQEALMASKLERYRSDLERDRAGETDIVDHAALVWKVLNSVVLRYAHDHPDWLVLRYEDLAREPVEGYRGIYSQLGLSWTDRIAAQIHNRNSSTHSAEVPDAERGGTRRDSRQASRTWTTRLTPEEIRRVRAATEEVATYWYDDAAWLV